jgi:DNA-directed RNA polymerase subunit RPC12/RpoP
VSDEKNILSSDDQSSPEKASELEQPAETDSEAVCPYCFNGLIQDGQGDWIQCPECGGK